MDFRYSLDPETGQPHIYDHGINEAEVEWVLSRPGEDGPSTGGARQSVGGPLSPDHLRPGRGGRRSFRRDSLSADGKASEGLSSEKEGRKP